jgi:hypothetical protein
MDWGIVIIISMLVIAYMYANKKEKKESTVFELKQDVFRKQLIHELNVEVFKQDDRCYIVGYQGGTFVITFDEKNHSVLLGYPFLNEIKHEDIPHVLIVENEINSNEIWSCSHSENLDCRSEYPLQVELNYFFIPQGTVKQSCEAIRRLFITAFEIGRKYNDLLKAQLEKQHSSIENENINGDFYHKLSYLKNRREANHEYSELGDEYPESEVLDVSQLIAEFDQTELGCLNNMRLIIDESVDLITDVHQILQFNIRDYVKNHPNRNSLKTIMIRLEFEQDDLIVNLRKANGCTDKTLFFHLTIVRSSTEADFPVKHLHKMIEIRLTTENEDFWEAIYMIDDALEKREKGKEDELTPEQRLIVDYVDSTVQSDLYWAKKYFNKNCFSQSLFHFKRILLNIKNVPSTQDSKFDDFYNEICLYVGAIYIHLNQYEKAYYYLHVAQREGQIAAIEEFMGCLWFLRERYALSYYREMYDKTSNAINNPEEETNEALQKLLFTVNRYLIDALIKNRELDEAESKLKNMLVNDYDTEYAANELDRINKIKEQEKKQ